MTTVADHVAEALAMCGTRHAWGMPGGDSLHLVRAFAEAGIAFHLVRDEASAGFAADASAQLTGAPGACLATISPGLTNMISGVVGCWLDRAPVLALTSRYRSDRHGRYTHMMFDQGKLLDGSAKAWWRMTEAGAPGEVRRALATALAPRPGPVWLEVPTEVAGAPCATSVLPPPPAPAASAPAAALVERVARWRHPVVLAGFAARHSALASLGERLRAPVLTTYKGKGGIPEGTGWSAGAAGLSPVADAVHRSLIERADGLLLIGWDPVELRDHWLPGWGDLPEVVVLDDHATTDLPARIDELHAGPLPSAVDALLGGGSTWSLDDVAAHRRRHDAVFEESTFGPATAIRAVQAGTTPDTVVTLDVGAHRITASHVWHAAAPDRLLQSNGFASMAYGLPAALAAAAHGHPTVCITGDMGLQMCMGELVTAAENEWPIVVVVLDDATLSLIALKQERIAHPDRGVRFANPAWEALARSVGGRAVLASNAETVTRAVRRGLAKRDGLTLVAARIDDAPYRRQM